MEKSINLSLKQKIFVAMETESFTEEKLSFSIIIRHKEKRHKFRVNLRLVIFT